MKYSKYPSYRDSGVKLLEQIPDSWEAKKLKYSARIQGGRDQKEVIDDAGNYPVYGSGGVFGYANQYLYNGKSVLLGRKGTVDKPLYVEGKFWTVDTMYYTILEKTTVPKWLYYCASAIKFDYYQYGSAVPSMTQEDLHNIYFATPNSYEQQTIANYLDKATAKIDTLIEKQTKLIELLREKRQAVISTAVTRGLDNTVAMKDSGVEWLGEIPEGWEISKLRYIFSFGKGLTITKANLKDKGIACVNYGEIHSKYGFEVDTNKHALKCVDVSYLDNSKSSLLSRGDFVFADTSEDIEGAGNFTHVTSETAIFAGYHTVIARQIAQNNFRFLAYLIDSVVFRTQIRIAVKGVKVFSITQAILKASTVWLPDIVEQQVIADYLDYKTSKIDTLITKSSKAIDLLKEKRTALISAAVTGKIDVREIA